MKAQHDEKLLATYEQLKKVRVSKTIELRPTGMLRSEISGFDGTPQPFRLRYYQVQGIFHLLSMNRMVLGDGTGLGKCKSAKSRVLTDRGLVPLGSLRPSSAIDLVEGGFYPLQEPTQVWTGTKWAPIKSFYWSGRKPAKVIRTSRGYVTDGSYVHPIWVRTPEGEKFVQTQTLKKGDWVAIARSPAAFPSVEPSISFLPRTDRGFTYPNCLTPALAAILGWVVGEAWVMSKHHVYITQYPGEGHNEIRRLLKEVFGWTGNQDNKEADKTIGISSVDIRSYLQQCGIDFQLSAGKTLPALVLQGTRSSARAFLQAFFEAEASVSLEGGVEVSSASKDLLADVQQLLLRFGVVSSLKPKWNKKYQRYYYRLNFFGVDARLFHEEIDFFSSVKRGLLEGALKKTHNTNKDVVPYCGGSVQVLRKALVAATKLHAKGRDTHNSGGWGLLAIGAGFQSTFKHVVSGRRNASYPFLRQLLKEAEAWGLTQLHAYHDLKAVVDQNFFYDQVEEVIDVEDELMDIEVDDPSHAFVADGFVNHNTIQAVGALCYLWERDPKMKAVVVCPKSAIRQWASEVDRFTTGVKVFVASGSLAVRLKAYTDWYSCPTPSLIVMNYHSVVRDWDHGVTKEDVAPGAKKGTQGTLGKGFFDTLTSKISNLSIIYDESTAFKNPSTKTHQTCKFLSERSQRVWGLTATLLKNNLMEGFGIYKVIRPQTFTSKTRFMDDYCVTEMQPIKGGGKIPIVVGYKHLDQFRSTIDPFFYGRPKHAVSDELPSLTTREVLCELSKAEDSKYAEALDGTMLLGDGEFKDFQDTKSLTSLIYTQEVVNSLALLKFKEGDDVTHDVAFEGKSAKEAALIDLLTEEFDDERVIIYTRFEKLVGRLQSLLAKERIKSVRITGKESDKDRKKAMDAFQDPKGKTRIIFITDAGSESINLQMAGAMVFFDTPWSWGNYVQLLGRMIRIGSPHQKVLAIHLVAERPGREGKKRETIDHKVIAKLRRKKGLIDQIIGEAAVGALRFEREGGEVRELALALRE